MRRRGLLAAGAALAGCAVRESARPLPGPEDAIVLLADHGWHTEVVLPGSPATSWGFGARGFFTSPSPGLGEFLAALNEGPAAIVVTPQEHPARAVPLPVSAEGLAAMRRFLDSELRRGAQGAPIAIGPGFRRGSVFYEAARPYSLGYTCNSWTMDALRAGGIAVRSRGVLTAADAMAEARRAAGLV